MSIRPTSQASSIRITTIYVITSSIWILGSDTLLHFLDDNQAIEPLISVLKGFLFVALTGVILYIYLRQEFGRRTQVEITLQAQMQQLRHSQLALEQSEARFRKAVDEAPLPMIIFAEDGEVLSVSRTWLEITGYRRDQLTSLDAWLALAYGEQRHAVKADIQGLFDLNQRVDEGEFTITCADGAQRIWVFSSTPLGRLSDNRRVLISIAADVTERRSTENALRESELRFRQIAKNIREVFYLYDIQQGQMLYVSPAYETTWGQHSASIYQNPGTFFSSTHPDDRQKVLESMQQQQQGQHVEITYRIIRADHHIRWVRSRTLPVFEENGTFHRIAGIIEDITDQVRYESQLKRLSQRLVTVLDSERTRIARELHDQVGQQLTGLSLSLAIVQAQCAPDHPAIPLLDDATELISSIIEHTRFIMADLRPLVLDDMGLAAGLRWYCEKFTRRTAIPISLKLPQETVSFTPMIANTFYQIAQEALMNVAKHAAATQAWVTLTVDEQQLKLTIGDNGQGFDAKDTRATDHAGSWGLQIMQERIQGIVGSRLSIDSQPGHGTRVMVRVQL